MTKTASTRKTARKQYTPEFLDKALKLAERTGVAAAVLDSACMNTSSITGAVNNSNE